MTPFAVARGGCGAPFPKDGVRLRRTFSVRALFFLKKASSQEPQVVRKPIGLPERDFLHEQRTDWNGQEKILTPTAVTPISDPIMMVQEEI